MFFLVTPQEMRRIAELRINSWAGDRQLDKFKWRMGLIDIFGHELVERMTEPMEVVVYCSEMPADRFCEVVPPDPTSEKIHRLFIDAVLREPDGV